MVCNVFPMPLLGKKLGIRMSERSDGNTFHQQGCNLGLHVYGDPWHTHTWIWHLYVQLEPENKIKDRKPLHIPSFWWGLKCLAKIGSITTGTMGLFLEKAVNIIYQMIKEKTNLWLNFFWCSWVGAFIIMAPSLFGSCLSVWVFWVW